MSETAQSRLASRLRELRVQSWDGVQVTQKNVAEALGASVALISSWESGGAVPPEERLHRYARFFATQKSLDGGAGHLLPAEDLTAEEDGRRQELIEELVRLREEALKPGVRARATGALGGRFWHFPDGQTITIVGSTLSERQVRSDYTRKIHPNYIGSLANGDMDAVIELVGHVRAENPGSEVRWLSVADITDSDQLTGHLVMLGAGDFRLGSRMPPISPMEWFIRRLDLPVHTRLPEGGDDEFDQEVVVTTDGDGEPTYEGAHEEVYRPRFLREERQPGRPRVLVDGFPQLEYDVGILARQPNALNLSATFTWCSGVFSRGTYGVVRALTDANLRARNERYIVEHFADPSQFWMVLQVPVFAGETITPDLARPFLRLRSSA
jgi:transcriptional regulator with XRE-family HTH domain